MEQSASYLQATLMKNYYKNFSKYLKGRQPEQKIAWVTSFTPIEILEALDIAYYYPESYAAVIAASGKEQSMLEESEKQGLSLECCAYSCCIEGNICLEKGPRGILPKPDVLIATNNQCNTLPNWWNILAHKFNVPLIVLDYPGESVNRNIAESYVEEQHLEFIRKMEVLAGKTLDKRLLDDAISNSIKSVNAWNELVGLLAKKEVEPTQLFDSISFLITSRCKNETSTLYDLLKKDMELLPDISTSKKSIFWVGYPLWYHPDRYFKELMDDYRICGSNYITWWNLQYEGESSMQKLFNAYNYTFLNLNQESRTKRLGELIHSSNAVAAITLINKSCKCDFVSAKNIDIPQVEIEIDMIDRNFADLEKAKKQFMILSEIL